MTDNPVLEPAEKFYGKTGDSEPTKPTDETVTKQVEEPEQEVEKLDTPEKSEEIEPEDSEKESLYLDLDGTETSLEDVRKWRDGHMMQSDYTKKTTTLSDERKTFESERDTTREDLLKSKAEVSELRDTLQALVQEDDVINWAELKVDDPDRYIELKEKADSRKTAIDKIKAERNTPLDDPALIADEQGKLFKANPEWLDDDKKPTEAFKADTKLMNDYVASAGFTDDEFNNLTRSHHLITILKAAKYDKLQEKGRKIKEDREKVPIVLKPKAKSTSHPKSAADVFYGT